MGIISITTDKTDVLNWLNDKLDNAEPEMENTINTILNLFEASAISYAPVRTGELAQSHTIEMEGLEGVMYPTAIQSIFVILGVPHEWIICPVEKKSLYWEDLGHPLPIGRCVVHPAMAANDYIQIAYETGLSAVDDLVDRYGDWLIT